METILNRLSLGSDNWETFEHAITREWLVTNGIGGYACGTVGEANTRRYHGLLMAALTPPVGRTLMVAALDVDVRYGADLYRLFAHEFTDGTVDPHGYLRIESFHLDRGVPVWRYAIADALLEKRVSMVHGENTTCVSFRVLRAGATLDLELTPLCTWRDYHSHSRGGWNVNVCEIADGFDVEAFAGARRYRVICDNARFVRDEAWHWNFRHRAETARGLDDREDLYRPGRFTLQLSQGEQATVVISTEAETRKDVTRLQQTIHAQQKARCNHLPADAPDWIRQLALAADQFIVERYQHDKPAGKTIIAGYPWFSDWGRDTMIALPGLTLVTRRFDVAASILRTFAAHVSEGMLPNRFPDSAQAPEYNTVDATLWFFHAVDQYSRRSGDQALATELYPVLADIIDRHRRGTRYGIRLDPADGLLAAGVEGVQLTWMDAKVDDWVVTPRIGKAVEINALWYNALLVMAELAQQMGNDKRCASYRQAAARTKSSFQRFWNHKRACLYDVIDGPAGELADDGRNYDGRLRPNQLMAVSLPHSPLNPSRQKSIVDVCARELLTPFGLRSLARGEPGYVGHYQGDRLQRDGAYHQGTVWPWLLGPFVDAHYRVYQDADIARTFLEPLALHLNAACVGSISEIFDAEPPYAARGCFAQAWSVAEVLRAWLDLHKTKPIINRNHHQDREHAN
jgi:predicted glycogen debranching enzyme